MSQSRHRCAIKLCPNKGHTNENLHYHGLPRDQFILSKWLQFITQENRCETVPNSTTFLCSDHFVDEFKGKKRLKKGAVPTKSVVTAYNDHCHNNFTNSSQALHSMENEVPTVSTSSFKHGYLAEYSSITEINNISAHEYSSYVEVNVDLSHNHHMEPTNLDKQKYSSITEIDMGANSDHLTVQNIILIETNQNQLDANSEYPGMSFAPENIFYSDHSLDQEHTEIEQEHESIMEIDNCQVATVSEKTPCNINQNHEKPHRNVSKKKCSAENCVDPQGSFFTMPAIIKNGVIDHDALNRLRKWIQNSGNHTLLNGPSAELHKRYFLCSKHFDTNQFTNRDRNRLWPQAIPTLFSSSPLSDDEMIHYPIYSTHHLNAELFVNVSSMADENNDAGNVSSMADENNDALNNNLDSYQQKFYDEMNSLEWHVCDKCNCKFIRKQGSNKKCVYTKPICAKFHELVIDDIPKELQNLTYIEEQLISKIHPIVSVIKLKGHQLGYQGNVINFPQDVQGFAKKLPHRVSDLSCVLTIRASRNLKPVDFQVRAEKVRNALLWLKQNNKFYFDVELSEDNMNSLPQNDNVFELLNGFDIDDNVVDPPLSLSLNDDQPEPSDEIVEEIYESGSPIMTKAAGSDQIESILSWPTISNQPINEFSDDTYIVQAFPCLFPKGNGNFKITRGRTESALNYFKHLMRFKDDRFAQHNRFRYFALNSYMRWSALRNGNLFIKTRPDLEKMTLTELKEELQKNPSLIKKLMFRNSSISGSKAYWFARGKELLSMVEQIGLPTLFVTLSAADLHWPELFKLLAPDEDFKTMSLYRRKQLVKDNPMTVDHFFLKRVEIFMEQVVIKKYNVKDYWFRIEYQHRGSPHMHGVIWIENAPDVTDIKNKSEQEQQQIVEYFSNLVTAFHPNVDQPPSFIHPSQKSLIDIQDLDEDLAEILNKVQRHTMCSKQYCIRKSKQDKKLKCRFNFPQAYQENAKLEFDENGNAQFLPKRNDERLNKYNAYWIQTWRGNMDVAPVISKTALINYLAKYISKSETKSDHIAELMKIINEAPDANKTAKYAVQRLYIKACAERDFSAQETCHLLMGLHLYSSGGRSFVTLNFNDSNDWRLLKNDDCSLSIFEKYQSRSEALDAQCLFQVAKCYFLPSEKPRKKQAVLQIYPKLSRHATDQSALEKFYRQQVLLFVPYRNEEQLKGNMATWKEVYDLCAEIIEYNSANMFNLHGIQQDREEFEETENNYRLDREEWMAVSAMGPSESIEEVPLGNREIDINYNWHEAYHLYEQYGGIPDLLTFIPRMKKEITNQQLTSGPLDEVILNTEQQSILDLVQLQLQTLRDPKSTQNKTIPKSTIIQGKAGTGKSLVISKMTKLLTDSLGQNSYLLLGPTGVSAVNINGSTIHSKLGLVKTNHEDFKHLNGQQLHKFKQVLADVKFVIIDEFSMVGCELMYWIDQRLRQAKDQPQEEFGGLFFYMFGDINQLPSVMDSPLYTNTQTSMEAIAGKILYENIETAFVLKEIHRQSDPVFQNILNNISCGKIIYDDYQLLKTRFTTHVGIEERKLFEEAAHFYPTNKEKDDFNYKILKQSIDPLSRTRLPVAKITAKTSQKKGNFSLPDGDALENDLYLSKGSKIMLRKNLWVEKGLVNGSVGTLIDIIYDPDATPQEDPPAVLICTFDSYSGPYLDSKMKTVPIGPTQLSHENAQGEKYTVSQFPVCLNYACTIYKSQGLTLEKAYIDIGKKEMKSGLTYVALSRTKTLSGLLLVPFEFDRLQRINNSKAVEKKQQWLESLKYKLYIP